jgi:two-component system response regulator (stage 0 sporulation protein A)
MVKGPKNTAVRILLCDADRQTRTKTLNSLDREFSDITYTESGCEALKLIASTNFDLIITDLMLKETDGIEIIEKAAEIAPSRPIILFTDFIREEMIPQFIKSGVSYVLYKDNHQVLCERVHSVLNEKNSLKKPKRPTVSEINITGNEEIERILKEMGFKRTHKGFEYLICALRLNADDPDFSMFITKRLYPEIAIQKKDKSENVEKVIRMAIEYAWKRRFTTDFLKYINLFKDFSEVKPTNAEFISIISGNFR